MSLINSLIFPDAGEEGEKVRELIYLPNKILKLKDKNTNFGLLRFGITCKIFNIEMQTGYKSNFIERISNNGYTLRSDNVSKPVVVLRILNYKRDSSVFKEWFLGEYRGVPSYCVDAYDNPKVLKNMVDTCYSYLPNDINSIMENKSIIINSKEVNKVGREWLKLLGIRQWAEKDTKKSLRYVLPKDLSDSDEMIQSAIKILKNVKEIELRKYIEDEKIAYDMLYEAKMEGREEQLIISCIKNVVHLFNNNYTLKKILKILVFPENLLENIYKICRKPNEHVIENFSNIHDISVEILNELFNPVIMNEKNKKRLREINECSNEMDDNKKQKINE
ncbi:hypothetical protein PIROE2DRAFT_2210 [Piromyces sp. E2]|nr:hypothetical protein PIROE2DRAFT_2210 [Piromyces sp. E2]|eukprot:OUM69787.1 hypothetical protein PIROE2DRAFT_2210 [Piromyces sp. E2]